MSAADIAAKLTKAQRECLNWVRPHSIIAPYRRGSTDIEALGLVERTGISHEWFTITPLGLAVRAILQAKEPTDDRS